MSAYIVSDEHLSYLISYASNQRVGWWDGTAWRQVFGNEQEVFNKLFRANMESVNKRYCENTPPMPSKFAWRGDTTVIQVLKACACFDYQACEVKEYERTEAARIVNEIRSSAIRSLTGYAEAEWEITQPPANKEIRLSDLGKKGQP
jgi:hypothetical protein